MRTLACFCCLLLLLAVGVCLAQDLPDTDDWELLDGPVTAPPSQLVEGGTALAEVPLSPPRPKGLKDRVIPGLMIVFLSASMLCALIGGRANAKRTLAFEEAFCKEPEGLLWKQFTRLGKGTGKLLVSESPSVFKLHANGHKNLDGAVMTMTLLRRHELISFLGQWLAKQEDVLCMELYVKESSMPLMVLAIVTPASQKELLRNHEDVKHLAHKIEVKEEKIKDWPHEGLVVYAEHSSYFYDMMTRPMLSQVFGGVAFTKQKQLFRGMQISSDSNSSHCKVMRFWFAIPPAEEMEQLTTLMTAAFAMVAQVSSYSISAERQKQAEQARQEFAKQIGKKETTSFAKEVVDNRKAKNKRK